MVARGDKRISNLMDMMRDKTIRGLEGSRDEIAGRFGWGNRGSKGKRVLEIHSPAKVVNGSKYG